MTHSDLSTQEAAPIVQACTQLIARFAQATDVVDVETLTGMFVEDGVFMRPSKPDQPYVGREAIREGFRARPADLVTRHIVANTVVDVVSATEARARSYLLLYTAPATDGGLPKANAKQMLGAFEDHIVRDADGAWRFRERRGSLAMSIGG